MKWRNMQLDIGYIGNHDYTAIDTDECKFQDSS